MGALRKYGARCLCGFVAAILGLSLLDGNSASGGFNVFLNPADPAALDATWNAGEWGDDWVPYVLGVASDDGSNIGAVDVDLRGVFHQRWNWSEESLDFASSARGLGVGGGDSHLLIPENALLPLTPYEDSHLSSANLSLPDVPGKYDYGVGAQLKGVWGIPGASAASQNLAYLVMPRGYESQLEYAIDVADSRGQLSRFRQGASFPALPPEPPVVVPEALPKHLNPLPSVVMPAPAVTPPTSPQPPAAVPPMPPATSGSNLFPWIAELDPSNDLTLPHGYKAYKFGISTNDGSSIAAVDFQIGSGALQVVKDIDGDGILDPTIRGTATTGADSHLLIPEGSIVMPLSEELRDYSEGSDPSLFESLSMGGAWGFPSELQSDTADLAYLVVGQSMDIQRIGMHLEVATRSGDTFLPTSYLMAKNFALLDASGNMIRPARVDLPPIVEEPVVPNEPPVVIDEPGPENPEGIPEIVVQDPPKEAPDDPVQEPTIIDEIPWTTIAPVRPIAWEPGIFVPTIDWLPYVDLIDIDVADNVPSITYVNYFGIEDGLAAEDGTDGSSNATLAKLRAKLYPANAAIAFNLDSLTSDYAMARSVSANAPEPSGTVLVAVALLGIGSSARRRCR